MMFTKIESAHRHLADHGWLSTYHLFSFADYYDPENLHWGNLRVFNDDTIAAQQGFGEHDHDNMEIVTIVLKGALTHKDSMGNKGTIQAGEVQHMSAGTGVTHAEMNKGDEPVHLFQIWIMPRERDVRPNYQQKDFSKIPHKNMLLPVASGKKQDEALVMQTNATIYLANLEKGQKIDHLLEKSQGVFIYVQKGSLGINGTVLNAFDQARISDEDHLYLTAQKDSEFVVIDTEM